MGERKSLAGVVAELKAENGGLGYEPWGDRGRAWWHPEEFFLVGISRRGNADLFIFEDDWGSRVELVDPDSSAAYLVDPEEA